MPSLLVELGTEELPAAYIQPALAAWRDGVVAALTDQRTPPAAAEVAATPRRLTLFLRDLPARAEDHESEVVGPPVDIAYKDGEPTVALQRWAETAGVALKSVYRTTDGKREKVAGKIAHKGRDIEAILGDVLPGTIASIPFPKSMRWGRRFQSSVPAGAADAKSRNGKTEKKGGNASAAAGAHELRFARPLRYVLALLDADQLALEVAGVPVGRETLGHPVFAGGLDGKNSVTIKRADLAAYSEALLEKDVMLSYDERCAVIDRALDQIAKLTDLAPLKADRERLLPEVANLVEYPGVVIGRFDEDFLEVPPEVVRTAIISHQRYFPLVDSKRALSNTFVTVVNRKTDVAKEVAGKGETAISAGNERVVRARLADARFFWDTDRAVPITEFAQRLDTVVWQDKLGTIGDKQRRVESLLKALNLAHELDDGAVATAMRAAALCKADLVTHMVFEFPELQGVMGGYYARHAGEPDAVCQAIGEHWLPKRIDDAVPSTLPGALLSLADKLDSLAGFFGLGLEGKGILGVRQIVFGLVRLAREHKLAIPLGHAFDLALSMYKPPVTQSEPTFRPDATARFVAYLRERLGGLAREAGYAHDHLAAVLEDVGEPAVSEQRLYELAMPDVFARLDALRELGAGSWAGWRDCCLLVERTGNITKSYTPPADQAAVADTTLLTEPAERALFEAYRANADDIRHAFETARYVDGARAYFDAFATIVHDFFDYDRGVKVMAEDAAVRENRLSLVAAVYRLCAHPFARLEAIVFEGEA